MQDRKRWTNKRKDFLLCPRSVVAPTQQPATDGHSGSPPSRFLTLNWSSWNVRLETMGESSLGILDHAMRPPGTGQAESRERERQRQRERDTDRESVCVCACVTVCVRVCVHPIICVFSAFCEGTRWGPFTPLWVLEAPCSHLLLSFVTNQVPFSLSSSPCLPSSLLFLFVSSFLYSLQPSGAARVHSWHL